MYLSKPTLLINKIPKQFKHDTDLEEVKIITDILHYTGTDPDEKKKIEIEQEAWRTVNAMFEDKEKELLKVIDENKKVIDENKKVIDEMARQLEDLKRRLGE